MLRRVLGNSINKTSQFGARGSALSYLRSGREGLPSDVEWDHLGTAVKPFVYLPVGEIGMRSGALKVFSSVSIMLLLLGCSRDAAGPDLSSLGPDEGLVAFDYSGAGVSGSYEAKGRPLEGPFDASRSNAGAVTGIWAQGRAHETALIAHDSRSRPTIRSFVLGDIGTAVGQRMIVPMGCTVLGNARRCSIGGLAIGDVQSGEIQNEFRLEEGSVRVTDVTPSRIRGTFQATGCRVNPDATGLADLCFPGTLTISSGRFDVPRVVLD